MTSADPKAARSERVVGHLTRQWRAMVARLTPPVWVGTPATVPGHGNDLMWSALDDVSGVLAALTDDQPAESSTADALQAYDATTARLMTEAVTRADNADEADAAVEVFTIATRMGRQAVQAAWVAPGDAR
jgi:hypothetical protein